MKYSQYFPLSGFESHDIVGIINALRKDSLDSPFPLPEQISVKRSDKDLTLAIVTINLDHVKYPFQKIVNGQLIEYLPSGNAILDDIKACWDAFLAGHSINQLNTSSHIFFPHNIQHLRLAYGSFFK